MASASAFNRNNHDDEVVRLCGNPDCRQPGHNITKCAHLSVKILIDKTTQISDYSIAFNYPDFIKRWLFSLPVTSLKLLHLNLLNSSFKGTPLEMLTTINHFMYEGKFHSLEENDRLVVRSHCKRNFTSPTIVNELTIIMNGLGVPTRLTAVQQIEVRVNNARNNLQLSNTRINLIRQRIINAELLLQQAEQELLVANINREPLITNVFNIQDELDEYRRTHTITGQLIQRKFEINTLRSKEEKIEEGEIVEDEDCPVCYDKLLKDNTVTMNCGHNLCNKCIRRCLDTLPRNQNPTCALCRAGIENISFKNSHEMRIFTMKYCSIIGEPVQQAQAQTP